MPIENLPKEKYSVEPPKGIFHFPQGIFCLIKQEDTGKEDVKITRISGNEFELKIVPIKLTEKEQKEFPVRICEIEKEIIGDPEKEPKEIIKSEKKVDLTINDTHRVIVEDGDILKIGNTISYAAGTNIITLDDNAGAGDSWGTAYTMENVLADCGAVVTKQGANAYDVSARMYFVAGVYFVSKSEFVELRPNPAACTYTFKIDAGGHVQFGDYNPTDKYSYNGAFWRVYVNSTTNQQNLVYGEWLIYGSNIWTNAGNYQKGIHAKAGATLRIYNSIIKDKRYFWAADTNMQDVKWIGGTGTYDMLFATGYDYSFSGVTSIDCNYGLFFSSTTNAPVDVYNQKFQGCTADVGLISTTHLIRVINSPFTTYTALGSGKSFKECYEFNVKITDSDGNGISGATVSLKDVDGNDAFSPENTVAGGVLTADKVVVRKWFRNAAQGGIKDYNNHTLKVVSGAEETEYKIKIDHKISEDVVLIPQSAASYDNIMTAITDIKGTGFVKDTDSLVDIRPETGKIQSVKTETDKIQIGIIDTPNTYKANVSNLDVAVSSRNDVTPPTVGEIKTELEGVGTKLTNVKTQTDKMNFSGNNIQARVVDKGVLNNPPSEVIADYKDKNTETEIKTAIDNYANKNTYKDKNTEQEIKDAIHNYANKDTYKATGFSVPNEYDIVIAAIQTEVDKIQTGIIDVPNTYKADVSDLTDILATVKRAVGLIHENYRLFSLVYDGNNLLTSATIKIYPTATDCDNDTNVLAEYLLTATYTNQNLANYKVTKV